MENKTEKTLKLPLINSDLRLDDNILAEQQIERMRLERGTIENYLENIDNEILIHYFYDFFENKNPEYKKYLETITFSVEEIDIDFDPREIITFECDYTEEGFEANINIEDKINDFFFQYVGKIEMDFLSKVSFINFEGINDKNYISKLYNHLGEDYLKEKEFKTITKNTHSIEDKKKHKRQKL